jgi:hypothetical protein
VCVGERPRLLLDRIDYGPMSVPEARHGRAAGGVEVAATLAVDQVDALPAYCNGRVGAGAAVKDVGRDAMPAADRLRP